VGVVSGGVGVLGWVVCGGKSGLGGLGGKVGVVWFWGLYGVGGWWGEGGLVIGKLGGVVWGVVGGGLKPNEKKKNTRQNTPQKNQKKKKKKKKKHTEIVHDSAPLHVRQAPTSLHNGCVRVLEVPMAGGRRSSETVDYPGGQADYRSWMMSREAS